MQFQRKSYEKRRKRIGTIIISIIFVIILVYWFTNKSNSKKKEPEPLYEKKLNLKPNTSKPIKKILNLPDMIKEVQKSIVLISTFDKNDNALGQGTGFIINSKGYVVSNLHVFRGAEKAQIKLNHKVYSVDQFLDKDNKNDLVLLKIGNKKTDWKPLKISNKIPSVGEKVIVIGNPLGLEYTVSDGIVSAKREIKPFGKVIQITSPISPGSSGSPVLNVMGEVIGVATFQMIKGQNLNFAIPISKVKKLISDKNKKLAKLDSINDEELKTFNTNFNKGLALFETKDYENAIKYFKEEIKDNPQNAKAYFYLGVCLRKNHLTDSIEQLKQAIYLDTEYIEAYYELGVTYIILNMQKESIDSFKKALSIDPNHENSLIKLGATYIYLQRYKSAIKILEHATDYLNNAKAYYLLGISYASLSKNRKAIFAFKNAIELDQDYIEPYLGLATSYIVVQNWNRGISLMNKAILIEPDNPNIHFLLGILHLGNEDIQSAELELKILQKIKNSYKLKNKLSSAINKYKYQKRYQ